MRSRMAGGMPGPLSSTENPAVPFLATEGSQLDAALGLLTRQRVLAVDQEVGRDLGEVIGIAEHDQRAAFGELRIDADAARACAIGSDLQRRAHDLVEVGFRLRGRHAGAPCRGSS